MKGIKYFILGTLFLKLITLNSNSYSEELLKVVKVYAENKKSAEVKPSYYVERVNAFEKMKNQKHKIVFLGSSTTEICDWAVLFQNDEIVNRGISGDTTSGVLNRIKQITDSKPNKLFIMIGRNDLWTNANIVPAINNYKSIIKTILKESPDTAIYIQSLVPNAAKNTNDNIVVFNSKLEKLANQYKLPYLNLYPLFINSKGILDPRYSNDGVHPNKEGYAIWKKAIEKYVKAVAPEKKVEVNATDVSSSLGSELFKDVKGHWAEQGILILSRKGIINGYNDGTFKPDSQLTRVEATVMILKAMNIKPAEDTTIDYTDAKDIPIWAGGYVKAALDKGMINGYNDKTLRINNNVTRQELVTLLLKALGTDLNEDKLKFEDTDRIAVWSKPFIEKALSKELITGYSDNTFRGENNITRAETCMILSKAFK